MVDFDKYRDANVKAFELTGGAAHGGLTVRDYFAAKAMCSIVKSMYDECLYIDGNEDVVASTAEAAYIMADAMMKERAEPVQQPTPSVEEAFGLNK